MVRLPQISSEPEDLVQLSIIPSTARVELIRATAELREFAVALLNLVEQGDPEVDTTSISEVLPQTTQSIKLRIEQVKFKRTILDSFKLLLLNANPQKAQADIYNKLSEVLYSSKKDFLQILHYFSTLDWYDLFITLFEEDDSLVEQIKKNPAVLLTVLELEKAVFLSAIKAVRELIPEDEWGQFIDDQNIYGGSEDLSNDLLKLNSAGLPDLLPVIKRFEKFVSRFISDDHRSLFYNNPYAKFDLLRDAFKLIAKEYFGEDYDTFYTRGGMDAFSNLFSRVLEIRPSTQFLMPRAEYLPIYFKIPEANRHILEPITYTELKSEMIECECDVEQEVIANIERLIRDPKFHECPIVVIVSSVPRSGIAKVNTNRLYEKIRSRFPHNNIKLWVDASQDPNPDLVADIVVRSKLVGGTGGGTAQIRTDYGNDDAELFIEEGVMVRSGFSTEIMARSTAAMFCSHYWWGHQVGDLLVRPKMWKLRGSGNYLFEEISKGRDFIDSSTAISGNITFLDPTRLSVPDKRDQIISFRPAEGVSFTVADLSNCLRKRGVDLTHFDFRPLCFDDAEFQSFYSYLTSGNQSEIVDLGQVNTLNLLLGRLTKYYQDWVLNFPTLNSLLMSGKPVTKKELLDFIHKEFTLNSAIRIKIKNTDKPNTFLEFLRRLESSIESLTSS